MKKIIYTFGALVMAVAIQATVVTIDFTDATTIENMGIALPAAGNGTELSTVDNSYTYQGVTMVSTQATNQNNDTKLYNSSGKYNLRVYKGNSLTFSASDTITGIDVTMSEGTFADADGGMWRGKSKSVTLTTTQKAYVSKMVFYVGEPAPSNTIDTISVSDAISRYNNGNLKACVVEGIVVGLEDNFIADYGNINIWLRDLVNKTDTIEGYKIFKGPSNLKYKSKSEIQFAMGDTILIYGNTLKAYNKQIELDGGYFVSRRGGEKPVEAVEINVTRALQIAMAMQPATGKRLYSDTIYAVSGYVIKLNTNKDNSYFMSDNKQDTYGTFQAYQCASIDRAVAVGDYVTVTGPIEAYNGNTYYNYEISGGTLVHAPEPVGFERVETDAVKAVKVMMNGQLYLIKDGALYNVMGAQIQ